MAQQSQALLGSKDATRGAPGITTSSKKLLVTRAFLRTEQGRY